MHNFICPFPQPNPCYGSRCFVFRCHPRYFHGTTSNNIRSLRVVGVDPRKGKYGRDFSGYVCSPYCRVAWTMWSLWAHA
jgi:hypothetical protein